MSFVIEVLSALHRRKKLGKVFDKIEPKYRAFAEEQHFFLVATAPSEGGRVNVSPKGLDSFRIIDENTVVYRDLTGSGNETAAHVMQNQRITFMFMSFGIRPMILRFYGSGRIIHEQDREWSDCLSRFDPLPGLRQFIIADIDRVSTSCGYGVPRYEFIEERDTLLKWADSQGEDGISRVWSEMNSKSIDGIPTDVLSRRS